MKIGSVFVRDNNLNVRIRIEREKKQLHNKEESISVYYAFSDAKIIIQTEEDQLQNQVWRKTEIIKEKKIYELWEDQL